MATFTDIRFFKAREFNSPDKMSQELIEKLDRARAIAGVPFKISSSFREGDPKAHGKGEAVDIVCDNSTYRFRIIKALILVGFTRIGVYDKHVHADVSRTLPQGVMWWGTSK